jgi:sigma-B regulation protein RsbU (phosphoserine phosphatase)
VQTVLEDTEQKVQAFKAGATDYICKPISTEELLARTRIHLTPRLLFQQMLDYRSKMHEEMHTAILMQSRIMPDRAHVQICERVFNMSIATHFETSSALGGDFWSMRPLSPTRLAITMLDFSGHGLGAAMNVFRIHTIMQECTPSSGDPAQYLAAINRQLHPLLNRHEFATMFYGIIDTEANCLLYASAAMHPALLYGSAERSIVPIQGKGFALGVVASATYETQFAPFMPDDMLLLYSDCLTETQDAQGLCLSEGKICLTAEKEMAKARTPNANAVVSQLYTLLKQHSPEPLADDLTICSYWRK